MAERQLKLGAILSGVVVAFLASPRSVAINGDTIGTGGGSLGSVRY